MNSHPRLRKIAEQRPLARLVHVCSVCGHPIAIGCRYDRVVVIDKETISGKPLVLKMHRGGCPSEVLNG